MFAENYCCIPYLVELAMDAILASVTAKLETTGK